MIQPFHSGSRSKSLLKIPPGVSPGGTNAKKGMDHKCGSWSSGDSIPVGSESPGSEKVDQALCYPDQNSSFKSALHSIVLPQ